MTRPSTTATTRLNLYRPEAANTVNHAMAHALRVAVEHLDANTGVVIIDAAGTAFCGGGGVVEMVSASDLPEYLTAVTANFDAALVAIARLDAIVVATVEGGAGLGLALAADGSASDRRGRPP